jgi:hypothetical protein
MTAIIRTPDERRVDAAILLTLWDQCAQQPSEDAGDKLRQMKLAYLAALTLAEARIRALTLSFYRWTWGPMSNEVCEAWNDLERAGLMDGEEHWVVTRNGHSLAQAFYEEVVSDERNVALRSAIDDLAGEWRAQPATGPLLEFIYELPVTAIGEPNRAPIRGIRKGAELLEPVEPKEAGGSVFVNRGWLETLALTLRPGAATPVRLGIADFRAGRVRAL